MSVAVDETWMPINLWRSYQSDSDLRMGRLTRKQAQPLGTYIAGVGGEPAGRRRESLPFAPLLALRKIFILVLPDM